MAQPLNSIHIVCVCVLDIMLLINSIPRLSIELNCAHFTWARPRAPRSNSRSLNSFVGALDEIPLRSTLSQLRTEFLDCARRFFRCCLVCGYSLWNVQATLIEIKVQDYEHIEQLPDQAKSNEFSIGTPL